MTVYQLWLSGQLDYMIERNLLKDKVKLYCEINQAFLLTRNGGNAYRPSLYLTAEAMNVSVAKVKTAISYVNKA